MQKMTQDHSLEQLLSDRQLMFASRLFNVRNSGKDLKTTGEAGLALTTVSGTPFGGMGIFRGIAPPEYDRLSNRHSPILPYVSSPWYMNKRQRSNEASRGGCYNLFMELWSSRIQVD
jgi:hypothetical protein